MKTERFIARRIVFSTEGKNLISRPVIRIATAGISIGFAVMVIAIAIVSGFQHEIREKLIGFNAHVQVSRFDRNLSYETAPIQVSAASLQELTKLPNIKHVQRYATKAGIVKKGTTLEGVVAKGIGPEYDWTFFEKHLVSGKTFNVQETTVSGSVIISKVIANRLSLTIGDSITMYFIQQPPRARKWVISGIYETGFEEFDKLYLFCDLRQLRKLNDWKPDEIGGVEIFVHDFKKLDETTESVYTTIGSSLNARSIKEIFPQIFDWLNLQDVNAAIIILLMLVVCGINMISALLVLMLERINMIGTLKSLGATDQKIRNVFLWVATYIIGRGLIIGNIIGVGLAIVQYRFHLIPLDQSSYYISYVPVELTASNLLLLNVGSLSVCLVMMVLPAFLIGKVRPVKALKYT